MKEENKALTASQCVSAITGEMSAIQKKKGTGVNYAFRGIDEVMDNLNPLLHDYGCALSTKMEVKTENVFLKKDGIDRKLSTATITVRINIVKDVVTETGIASTSHSIEGVAYSDDYGDKAATQAQSLAFKYAIIFGFCVRTKDMVEDTDNVQKDHANTTSSKAGASTPPQNPPAPQKETPPTPPWTPESFETFKVKVVNMPIARNSKDKTKWALKIGDATKTRGVFCNATDDQAREYCVIHKAVLVEQGITIPVELL